MNQLGNLDSKTSASIMELFENLHKNGQTIILVTHEKEISEYAKKKIVLKDGNYHRIKRNYG